MKYQIILESNELLADDEFEKLVRPRLEVWQTNGPAFEFKLARSLEGIREEVWKRKEELKTELNHYIDGGMTPVTDPIMDQTFEDLSDLFKLT